MEIDSELDFNDWIESIVIVDKKGIPIDPKLVDDLDEGEDGD